MSQKQIRSTFCVNLTFFPPDCKDWSVPDDSSPFMCYDVERDLERYDGGKITAAKMFYEQLRQWVKSFQAAEKRCKIQIHLWLEDANTLCQHALPEDLEFDFIDTSNLADDLGLIPILVFCHEELKEDGVMRAETFDSYKCGSHGEHFLRLCIDIPYLMYPTVLGFHLAEELIVGHDMVQRGHFEGVNKLVFRWRKAGSFTPCTLTGADAISSCLESIQSPKPLQSTEVFQKVKPALLDDETKSKISDRLKKMTIDQGHKLWEGQATTFVTVYNHDVASRLVRQGQLTLYGFMKDVGDVSGAHKLTKELLQGYDILADILEINSYRLRQDRATCKWKMRSFIRARYPFKPWHWHFDESDMRVKYADKECWNDPFAMMRETQKEEGQQELFSSPEARKVAEAAKATFKPICGFCGKMTDCKKCTTCDNIYYCSINCQKRSWPHHKQRCRKY